MLSGNRARWLNARLGKPALYTRGLVGPVLLGPHHPRDIRRLDHARHHAIGDIEERGRRVALRHFGDLPAGLLDGPAARHERPHQRRP